MAYVWISLAIIAAASYLGRNYRQWTDSRIIKPISLKR